jgi:tetratricopeptide (TPR) repeat protein
VTAADRLGDVAVRAYTYRMLGRSEVFGGRYAAADAPLRRAFALYSEAGDPLGQARTHFHLSHLAAGRGDLDLAMDHAHQSLAACETAGNDRARVSTLVAIGWYQVLRGNHTQALVDCQRAMTEARRLGWDIQEANAWDNFGDAHRHLGHPVEAIQAYYRALALFGRAGDRYRQAVVFTSLGEVHRDAGDAVAARVSWMEALAILVAHDHPDADSVRAKIRGLG